MRKTTLIRPSYAESFRCIGPACEDTCCAGWTVPIDRAAWEKYRSLSESPLRALIDANVVRAPEPSGNSESASNVRPTAFATVRMNAANQCPLLTADRLCRIQAELGESLLSHTCATYPRIVHSVGGHREMALSMSCPEAARLEPVINFIPLESRKSAGVLSWSTMKGWETEVRLVTRAT